MNRSLFLQNNISKFVIRYPDNESKNSFKAKSVSVSSEYSLPKHTKKKSINHRSEVVSIEKKQKKSVNIQYSMHTNGDQKKEERQYSKVPIEYLDERDSGNPADRVRGRVVYRGYAPKNTYYYFKTIKELKLGAGTKTERDYRGEDLTFNSKFQSGNLNAAVRISSREYWLYMREDTNTHGLRQWFYFQVRSRRKGPIRFRIYKFSKRFSLYKTGMKPFIRTVDSQWHQQGQKVAYEYDSQQRCFYLQFEYSFEEHKQVYFASLPPYTYSKMADYLQSLAIDQKVAIRKIGLSLCGLDIYSIVISDRKCKKDVQNKDEVIKNLHGHHKKQAIVVLSRTHPGETVSNWALQNFIEKVLDTPILTQQYNFFIVPIVNPDGVFLGNHRTGVLGQDLNRNFHGCDIQFFPQVDTVESYITHIQKKQKIAFLFDLHGHSAKKNIFAFGQECQIGSGPYLFGRVLPKILSNLIDSFKYDHCVFKASKQKTNTARVYFSTKYGINAITFEQSYGLLETGCIGIANWRNFGTALAESLIVYLSFKKQNLEKEIRTYLQDLIKEDKESIIKKRERKLQLQRLKELQKEKEKQKDREEMKIKAVAKTEGAEETSSKILSEFFNRVKNTPRNLSNIQEQQLSNRSSNHNENKQSSDSESQLSSGDEELQLKQGELQVLKKDIFKVGVINREIIKRQPYSMAEKKMQLGHQYVDYTNRLHHKQSPVVQRIYKFKSRHRQRQTEMIPNYFSFRQKNQKGSSIELPAIRR